MYFNINEKINNINSMVYEKNRYDAFINISKIVDKIYKKSDGDDYVNVMVFSVMNELLNIEEIIEQLTVLRNIDEYTYFHCLNVCQISIVLALRLGYRREELYDLAVGALFHDLGKILMSQNILKKPSQLTNQEYEEIKKHAIFGYKMATKFSFINEVSSNIILNHHERLSGSGYPFGRTSETISNFTRIVSVADVYDAMTTDRVYKEKIPYYQAIKHLKEQSEREFDNKILNTLITSVCGVA